MNYKYAFNLMDYLAINYLCNYKFQICIVYIYKFISCHIFLKHLISVNNSECVYYTNLVLSFILLAFLPDIYNILN